MVNSLLLSDLLVACPAELQMFTATRLPLWGLAYLNPPNPLFKGAHQAFVRT